MTLGDTDHARDQEIRNFCELLRLTWTEDPDYTFCELIELVIFNAGGHTDWMTDDADSYRTLKRLYHEDSDDIEVGELVCEKVGHPYRLGKGYE